LKSSIMIAAAFLSLAACQGSKYTTTKESTDTPAAPAAETKFKGYTAADVGFYSSINSEFPLYVISDVGGTIKVYVLKVQDPESKTLSSNLFMEANESTPTLEDGLKLSLEQFKAAFFHHVYSPNTFETTDEVCVGAFGKLCGEAGIPKQVNNIPMYCYFSTSEKSYDLMSSYSGLGGHGRRQMFILMENEQGKIETVTFLSDNAEQMKLLTQMGNFSTQNTVKQIELAISQTKNPRFLNTKAAQEWKAKNNLTNFFSSFYTVDARFYSETEGHLTLTSARTEALNKEPLDETELDVTKSASFIEHVNYIKKDGSIGTTFIKAGCSARVRR